MNKKHKHIEKKIDQLFKHYIEVEIKLDSIEKALRDLRRSIKPELDMANRLIGGLYDKLEDIKDNEPDHIDKHLGLK